MDLSAPVLFAAVASAALGLLAGWLLARGRARRDLDQAIALEKARSQAETQALLARLELREQELERARLETKERTQALERTEDRSREQAAALSALEAQLAAEQRRAAEQLVLLESAERRLADAFEALAGRALERSSRSFLDLAQETLGRFQAESTTELEEKRQQLERLLQPLADQLHRYEQEVRQLERARQMAYGELLEKLKSLAGAQESLVQVTGKLVTALRRPEVRGSWGEMQLRRTVELAGLVEHVDFLTQATISVGDQRLRPDLLVRLPGNRTIAVDAKAPLEGYLAALEAETEETRRQALARHAAQLRERVRDLASRDYAAQIPDSPDLVVLFLPVEAMFAAALDRESRLLDEALSKGVLLATPVTLVALLKTVAHAWRQEALARNARAIADAGHELHQRLGRFAEHLSGLGRSLGRAVEAYNQAVGSFESRLLPQARRLEELQATEAAELDSPPSVGVLPRTFQVTPTESEPSSQGERPW